MNKIAHLIQHLVSPSTNKIISTLTVVEVRKLMRSYAKHCPKDGPDLRPRKLNTRNGYYLRDISEDALMRKMGFD